MELSAQAVSTSGTGVTTDCRDSKQVIAIPAVVNAPNKEADVSSVGSTMTSSENPKYESTDNSIPPILEASNKLVADVASKKPLHIGDTVDEIETVKVAIDVTNDSILEPPTKRQKTNEATSDAGQSVVLSNSDAVCSVAVTSTAPILSMAPVKPFVNANINHTPSLASTTHLLLPDYSALQQTVHDLLALLQLYGPLTANQLEYNLPPVVPTSSIYWNVHDVLSILVAIGLVQHVKGTTDQYCIFGGIPRATAIFPTELPFEIQRAINEAEESFKRCQIIRDALRHGNTSATSNHNGSSHTPKNYKDVLKQLLQEYPSIANDPVYWTALRSCHIDMGSGSTNLQLTEKRSNPSSRASTKGVTKGTASANVREGGKPNKSPKIALESSGSVVATIEKKPEVITPALSVAPPPKTSAVKEEKQQPSIKLTEILTSSTTPAPADIFKRSEVEQQITGNLGKKTEIDTVAIGSTDITPQPTIIATSKDFTTKVDDKKLGIVCDERLDVHRNLSSS